MERDYTDRFLATTQSLSTTDAGDPRTVLHRAFNAIIGGDFGAFGEAVTDDVELSISGFGAMDGKWRGRDDVIAATRQNFAQLDGQRPEIEGMIFDRDRVAVLLHETGVLKSSGEPYDVRGVQWFTFADGKIKKIDEIVARFAA